MLRSESKFCQDAKGVCMRGVLAVLSESRLSISYSKETMNILNQLGKVLVLNLQNSITPILGILKMRIMVKWKVKMK
jgi:hypothetical protein